jgi:hypothetical protein
MCLSLRNVLKHNGNSKKGRNRINLFTDSSKSSLKKKETVCIIKNRKEGQNNFKLPKKPPFLFLYKKKLIAIIIAIELILIEIGSVNKINPKSNSFIFLIKKKLRIIVF